MLRLKNIAALGRTNDATLGNLRFANMAAGHDGLIRASGLPDRHSQSLELEYARHVVSAINSRFERQQVA